MISTDKSLESSPEISKPDIPNQKSDVTESQENKEETDKNSKKIQIIHRTIVLGKRVFEYAGPVNQDILDLLDLIEANSSEGFQGFFRFVKVFLKKIEDLNEKIEKKFTCFRGFLKLNLNDFFLIFNWLLLFAVACIRLKVFLHLFFIDFSFLSFFSFL